MVLGRYGPRGDPNPPSTSGGGPQGLMVATLELQRRVKKVELIPVMDRHFIPLQESPVGLLLLVRYIPITHLDRYIPIRRPLDDRRLPFGSVRRSSVSGPPPPGRRLGSVTKDRGGPGGWGGTRDRGTDTLSLQGLPVRVLLPPARLFTSVHGQRPSTTAEVLSPVVDSATVRRERSLGPAVRPGHRRLPSHHGYTPVRLLPRLPPCLLPDHHSSSPVGLEDHRVSSTPYD